MSLDDQYADFRPQRLRNPFANVGWIMLIRGLFVVLFGFYAITAIAAALRAGRYAVVATLLAFGFGFIAWGARAISRGTAIGLRFGVRRSAPADLANRIDPHTGDRIGYGACAYNLQSLKQFFLRKELPHRVYDDLIDQILSALGRASQPFHPSKRDLIVDTLRGAFASAVLLAAFIAAFGFIQFDPVLRDQPSIMNFAFLIAFVIVLKYWGLRSDSVEARQDISLANLLRQMGFITLSAVVLPIALSAFGPIATLFSKTNIPSPLPLLCFLVSLAVIVVAAIVVIAVVQSKRPVYSREPVLSLSEMAPVEAYGRLLPKDLLNALARYIAGGRTHSLDDRVYAFSETRGQGHEGQPSDLAEYVAESAPLLRNDLLVTGKVRLALIAMAIVGEALILLSAFTLFNAMTGYVELVRQTISNFIVGNFAAGLAVFSHPLTISFLFVILLARFGNLFREIAFRFLGEVIFQSFVVTASISSSIQPGPAEITHRSGGTHFFDAGRTSRMEIRIQASRLQTATMVSPGSGADSLGAPRYIIAAERADTLLNALRDDAYRYIAERTSAAATTVRSASVETKDLGQFLVDSTGRAPLGRNSATALLGPHDNNSDLESDRKLIDGLD
jgi:hypothetical protein